jgi:hypothetical protein
MSTIQIVASRASSKPNSIENVATGRLGYPSFWLGYRKLLAGISLWKIGISQWDDWPKVFVCWDELAIIYLTHAAFPATLEA